MSNRSSIEVLSVTGEYLEHAINPEILVDFIHEDGFDEDWTQCGLTLEGDLWDFETILTLNPDQGRVIPKSGGLRKARYKRPGQGKRGGVRVIYLWIPEISIIYLFMVYPKSTTDNISQDVLSQLRQEVNRIRTRLIAVYNREI